MNRDVEYTTEEQQRAQALIEGDGRSLNNTGNPTDTTDVTAERCRIWRNYVAQGKHTPHSMPASRALKTIERHVKGNCQHEVDRVGLPCEYMEQDGWSRVGVVREADANKKRVVVHTRHCDRYPENGVVRVSELGHPGVELSVCSYCSGSGVPEASPLGD
jgi:hypothetical protein